MRTVAGTRPTHLDPSTLPAYDYDVGWYVYWLWLGPELVYVGKTRDLHQRMRDHRSSKHFDRATYHACDDKQSMVALEREWIAKARPRYNKRGLVPQVIRP